jgi:hypothetical protein
MTGFSSTIRIFGSSTTRKRLTSSPKEREVRILGDDESQPKPAFPSRWLASGSIAGGYVVRGRRPLRAYWEVRAHLAPGESAQQRQPHSIPGLVGGCA